MPSAMSLLCRVSVCCVGGESEPRARWHQGRHLAITAVITAVIARLLNTAGGRPRAGERAKVGKGATLHVWARRQGEGDQRGTGRQA